MEHVELQCAASLVSDSMSRFQGFQPQACSGLERGCLVSMRLQLLDELVQTCS